MATKNISGEQPTRKRRRGDGAVYLRGEIYWIRYSHRGKEKRESSYSADESFAWNFLDRRMKELWAERQGLRAFAPKAEKVYVDLLLDTLEKEYRREAMVKNGGRGLPAFKSHLKPIREAFGNMRAVNVTKHHVDDYIDRRLEVDGKQPSTVNRETQLLGQAFTLGIKNNEIISAPPIRHLTEKNVRQGFFERAEFDAIVQALPEYLQDFAQYAYLSAWRCGQAKSLTWSDVDRAAGVIQARGQNVKNGDPHRIVLEGELAAIIERRWQARVYQTPTGPAISNYVFHRDGKPIGDFRKAWATACKKIGLVKQKVDGKGRPVVTIVDGKKEAVMVHTRVFHDFRRSGVRNMVRAGVRETVAMSISGHKTRSVFDRYNITSEDDQRQALKRTDSYLQKRPAARKVATFGKKN